MYLLVMAWNTHKEPRLWGGGRKLLCESCLVCAKAPTELQDGNVRYVAIAAVFGPGGLDEHINYRV